MSVQPKIVMTLLVRNEEDIIAENIRFHRAMGVDSFIVMDNLSTDGTAQILKDLSSEVEIDYLLQTEDTYNQWEWVTGMARRAATQHGADWVINNDADEFWMPETGDLKTLLASLPATTAALSVERHNAVVTCPAEAPLEGRSHPHHTTMFERQSLNVTGHPLPGKVLHRASAEVTVAQGNHAVEGLSGTVDPAGTRLCILHFPFRSLAQYESKIRLGGAAYARNTSLSPVIGGTWRTHYTQLTEEDAGLNRFWAELSLTPEEVDIGRYAQVLDCDTRLKAFFDDASTEAAPAPQARPHLLKRAVQRVQRIIAGAAPRLPEAQPTAVVPAKPDPMSDALSHLLDRSSQLVGDFTAGLAHHITNAGRDLRWERPMYHNLRFAVSGAEAHLAKLQSWQGETDPQALLKRFPEVRDCFSLFPRNGYLKEFLTALLGMAHPDAISRLRSDCAGKRVILHTSCQPRLQDTLDTIASFKGLDGPYHHIILMGQNSQHTEHETPLSLEYDGQILRVPTPDNYESLHRKLFYAFMLLDLVAKPELVVKIDDNLVLEDPAAFEACLQRVTDAKAAYAGRRVGADQHQSQWHGWHLGKCADPLIEARGYQYPLPRDYTAGGHGYILGPEGLAACTYMYLAMQTFFAMPVVGLEDACVGHAAYAQGVEIFDLSDPERLLALPGLATKEMLKREQGWEAIFGPRPPRET